MGEEDSPEALFLTVNIDVDSSTTFQQTTKKQSEHNKQANGENVKKISIFHQPKIKSFWMVCFSKYFQ